MSKIKPLMVAIYGASFVALLAYAFWLGGEREQSNDEASISTGSDAGLAGDASIIAPDMLRHVPPLSSSRIAPAGRSAESVHSSVDKMRYRDVAAELFALRPSGGRNSRLDALFFEWAGIDPASACAFLETEVAPGTGFRYELASRVLDIWLESDFHSARSFALQALGRNDNARLYLQTVFQHQVLQDGGYSGLEALLASLPSSEEVQREVAVAIGPLITNDPERSRGLIDSSSLSETQKITLNRTLGAALATKKGVEMLDGVLVSESGSGRLIFEGAIDHLNRSKPDELGRWLIERTMQQELDIQREQFLEKHYWDMPELAIRVALAMNDPALRQKQVQLTFSAWLEKNPGAARTWASAAAVPKATLDPVFRGEIKSPPKSFRLM